MRALPQIQSLRPENARWAPNKDKFKASYSGDEKRFSRGDSIGEKGAGKISRLACLVRVGVCGTAFAWCGMDAVDGVGDLLSLSSRYCVCTSGPCQRCFNLWRILERSLQSGREVDGDRNYARWYGPLRSVDA